MFYVLVHFPGIDNTDINRIRRRYDPTFRIIDPHITLMFPVLAGMGEEKLVRHLISVLGKWKSFPIHLKGFVKSWDHWLFMTLDQGKTEIEQLYHDIYTGILTEFKRPDIPFIPHLGLGLFVTKGANYELLDPKAVEFDQNRYETALEEAKKLNLDYRCVFNKVHLLKLNENLTRIMDRKTFKLEDRGSTIL